MDRLFEYRGTLGGPLWYSSPLPVSGRLHPCELRALWGALVVSADELRPLRG